MSEWRKIRGNGLPNEDRSPKSGHRMAAEGMPFPWQWYGGTISPEFGSYLGNVGWNRLTNPICGQMRAVRCGGACDGGPGFERPAAPGGRTPDADARLLSPGRKTVLIRGTPPSPSSGFRPPGRGAKRGPPARPHSCPRFRSSSMPPPSRGGHCRWTEITWPPAPIVASIATPRGAGRFRLEGNGGG